MCGGNIIDCNPVQWNGKPAYKLAVLDADPNGSTEREVIIADHDRKIGPKIGERVWWQAGEMHFAADRMSVKLLAA